MHSGGQMTKFLVLILGVLCCTLASATPITFNGSQDNLAASVTFDKCGSALCATLSNTSTHDVLVPTDVLTGVYWKSSVPLNLTAFSVVLSPGSHVNFGTTDPGGVVGGEFAYVPGLVGHPGDYAVGSAGYLPGIGYLFPGSNLQGPVSLDGPQYGIVSFADNPLTGNTPVTGTNALIVGGVQFVLTGLPEGFEVGNIHDVYFQYGTALSDPGFGTSTPEPISAVMFLSGGTLLLALGRLRRKQ